MATRYDDGRTESQPEKSLGQTACMIVAFTGRHVNVESAGLQEGGI